MADAADIASEYMERIEEARVENRIRYQGVSLTHCIDCEEQIPQRRRDALPGVERCVDCQELAEACA